MELALHVLKIFTQDRVQQLFAELIPMFSLMILSRDRVQQRLVVLMIMVTVLFRDRVQQRLVERIFASRVSASAAERQWSGRGCAYGDWCTFAHSWAELLSPKPNKVRSFRGIGETPTGTCACCRHNRMSLFASLSYQPQLLMYACAP